MRRLSLMVMMWATLAMPVLAMAGDQAMPPETNWPHPLARSIVDVNRLARILVTKGVITPHEYAQLTQPQASSPASPGRARMGTGNNSEHDPVQSTGD